MGAAKTTRWTGLGVDPTDVSAADNYDNGAPDPAADAPGDTIACGITPAGIPASRFNSGTFNFIFDGGAAGVEWWILAPAAIGTIAVTDGAPSNSNFPWSSATCSGGTYTVGAALAGDVVLAGGGLTLGGALDGQVSATADSAIDWGGQGIAGSFDASGHAITHANATGTLTIDTAGNLDLGVTVDANNPLAASTAALHVVVNLAGTATATRGTSVKTYTRTAGTFVDGGFTHFVGGLLSIASGTSGFNSTGVWDQTASGDAANANSANAFAHVRLGGAGVNSVLAANLWAHEFTAKAGGTISGAGKVLTIDTFGNDKWHQPVGSAALSVGSVLVYVQDSYTWGRMEASAVAGGVSFSFSAGNKTLTAIGDWLLGARALSLFRFGDAVADAVDMNGRHIQAGNVSLGYNAKSSTITLKLGNAAHRISGTLGRAAGSTGTQAIEMGTSLLDITGGALNGAGITVTNTASHIQGGTVSNVNNGSTEPIHCHGSINLAPGNTNTNVDFDAAPAPGSRALCGMGV
jgi:hypothetical protein